MSEKNDSVEEKGDLKAQPSPEKPQSGIPRSLVGLAVLVGLGLVGLGVYLVERAPTSQVGTLMCCVGFGIVLAAFGAQISGQWMGWSVVGSGAMAVLLFLLLQQYKSPPPSVPYVYGFIRNSDKMEDVAVSAQDSFLVGRRNRNSDWEFFARKEWLNGSIFSIRATPAAGIGSRQIIFGCLPLQLLRDSLGNPDGVDLTLVQTDSAKEEWMLTRTGEGAAQPLGYFGNPICPVQGRAPINISWFMHEVADLIAPPAFAESLRLTAPALKALGGRSLSEQAQAQDAIAKLRDNGQIADLVQKWQPAVWNDSSDASLLIAWVAGIRQNRDMAAALAAAFNAEQLDHIVELTGSEDRTTRFNATELLSWLLQSTAWPNPPSANQQKLILDAVLKPFTKSWLDTIKDSGRGNVLYNSLVALTDAKCDMRATDQNRSVGVLSAFEQLEVVRSGSFIRSAELSQQYRAKNCK